MLPTSLSSAFPPVHSAGCPTEEDLLAFIPGLLPEDSAVMVAEHVGTCSICQSRVTTLRRRILKETANLPAGDDRPAVSDPTLQRTLELPKQRTFPKKLGQYELCEPIGRGGMGIVFKALHPRLQRQVAIKLLPGLGLSEPTAIVRLQRETAAAGKVEHENVVYAFDAGEQDGIDYLVMEYVDGVDASRLVTALGPLPLADACEIGRQAALGLAHVESRGMVHRDIKPSNLMVSKEGVVKILDLGLARLREGRFDDADATHSGFLLGTADYISPEQIDDPRSADMRSDLYSLGCTLFKLLTGRAPFGDDEHLSVSKKLDAHRHVEAPDVRELRPNLPQELSALIGRMLSKRASERPASAGEVADALSAFTLSSQLRDLVARVHVDQLAPAEDRCSTTPAPSNTPQAAVSPMGSRAFSPPDFAFGDPASRGSLTAWKFVGGACVAALLGVAIVYGLPPSGNPEAVPHPAMRPDDDVPRDQAPTLEVLPEGSQELLGAAREVRLAEEQSDATYDEKSKQLRLSAANKQMLVLGNLQPGAGTVSFDLDFTDDLGDAGIFFGKRDEVRDGDRAILAHLIYLNIFAPNEQPVLFRLWRMQGVIKANQNPPRSLLGRFEDLPLPDKTRTFLFELDYGQDGITSIKLNRQPYPTLLSMDGAGGEFNPADLWGEWGLFNDGATLRVSNMRVYSR